MAKQPRRSNGTFGPMPRPPRTVTIAGYRIANLAHYVHDVPDLRPVEDGGISSHGGTKLKRNDDPPPPADDPGARPKRRRPRPSR
jgi:hypothetical protein